MDKQALRSFLADQAVVGMVVSVQFRSGVDAPSGLARVTRLFRGRGRGGSLYAELEMLGSDQIVTVGTPRAGEVLNLTFSQDGENVFLGDETEAPVREVDQAHAALKAAMEPFLGADGSATVQVVRNGVSTIHRVTSCRRSVGRHGQLVASLVDVDGNQSEVWSFRDRNEVSNFVEVTGFTLDADQVLKAAREQAVMESNEDTDEGGWSVGQNW